MRLIANVIITYSWSF